MMEFDCSECGRHVIAIIAESVPYGSLCQLCIYLPGWHEDFEMRTVMGVARGAAWPFP